MRSYFFTLCTALMATVCAAPALAGPKPGDRPPPIEHRIPLGGHVDFGAESLQTVTDDRGACVSPPFTADEIEGVGRGHLFNFVTGGLSGPQKVTRMVKLDARNGLGQRIVALSTYLDEINAVERFYNSRGYTLRHGPLAARRLPRGKACRARGNSLLDKVGAAMIRVRLVDPPSDGKGTHIDNGSVPQTKPNGPAPGDVMLIGKLGQPLQVDARNLHFDLGAGSVPRMAGQSVLLGAVPLAKAMKLDCGAQCALTFGKTTFVRPEAQALIDRPDEIVRTEYTCNVLTDSADNAKNCDPLQKVKLRDVTRRQEWAKLIDVDFFLAHFGKPCEVRAKEGQDGFDILYTSSQASVGNEEIQTGKSAANFFDGSLHYKNTGIADCILDMGSNSLFGAQFCLRYDTQDDYSPGAGFHIVDSAGLVTSATLFGLDFDLMNGMAAVDWRQPRTPPVAQPTVNSTLQQASHTEHYEGPRATIAFGPVPITIRSFADATLEIGQPQPEFAPPPLQSGVAGVGKIGMRVGAGTDVAVGMDAAVDAFVLSAGVSGKLSLLNNHVDGSMVSRIDPKANELNVDKSYTLRATTLKGSVSAFVEVDLLVYSERYEVDIVSFPGNTTEEPLSTKTWGPIHAVIPGTAATSSPCGG